MTVFITQWSRRYNYSSAEEFGKLVKVTTDEHEVFPDTTTEQMLELCKITRSAMGKFRPEHDYLLLAGDPIIQSLCFGHLVDMNFSNPISCLKRDRTGNYFSVELGI